MSYALIALAIGNIFVMYCLWVKGDKKEKLENHQDPEAKYLENQEDEKTKLN